MEKKCSLSVKLTLRVFTEVGIALSKTIILYF